MVSYQTKQMTITVPSNVPGKVYASAIYDRKFLSAIEGLQSFVFDTTADIDMAYDWVCEQAGISTFVADNVAWDLFYEMYITSAQDAEVPDHIIAGDYRY